jgi:O-acetyl-ADP-ribose deacetylase (regulator of RNase III)
LLVLILDAVQEFNAVAFPGGGVDGPRHAVGPPRDRSETRTTRGLACSPGGSYREVVVPPHLILAPAHPHTMLRERTYRFGESTLTLRFGDIAQADAQVIVSSDDSYITMGGGVSASILRVGGEAIALDASKKVPAPLGDVVVTTAGALPAQYVFHAITIGPNPEQLSHTAIVERVTRRCMQMLDGLQLSSIAFPAIGAGVAGFAYEDVAVTMAEVIADCLRRRDVHTEATIYLFDRLEQMKEMDFLRFFEEFAARSPRIAEQATQEPQSTPEPKSTVLDLATETEEEYKRRRIHNVRRLLAQLEDQRAKLEQKLISLLGKAGGEIEQVRRSLKDNQELRLQYLAELRSFTDSQPTASETGMGSAAPSLTIFVSSTYKDLVEYRTQAKDTISRAEMFFRGMEHFGASPGGSAPAALIVEEVKKADAYLGIFGVRYGSIDPVTGLSMTELEFREAESSKKQMLLYVIHEDTPVAVGHVETDPESQKKLNALKAYIMGRYVAYAFRSVDDLGRQVLSDLQKLRKAAPA